MSQPLVVTQSDEQMNNTDSRYAKPYAMGEQTTSSQAPQFYSSSLQVQDL